MAAFNIQEALIWKEKIELVIDQVDYNIRFLCIMYHPFGILRTNDYWMNKIASYEYIFLIRKALK